MSSTEPVVQRPTIVDHTNGTRPSCNQVDGQNKDAEIAALKSDYSRLRDENKQLQAKLENQIITVGILGKQIGELTKSLHHSQAELQKSEEQSEILKAVIKTKEDEITTLVKQLKDVSDQLTSKCDELAKANEKLEKVESERRVLQEASAEPAMQSDDEDNEVKSQLTTLQRRYDEVVLETAALRNKLFYATAAHGIYLVQL